MLGMFQSLIAPRYPRRYVGRHRARRALSLVSSAVARRSITAALWEQTAN